MPGPFYPRELTGSTWDAFPITPSDAEELSKWVRGLYVGGGGDVHVLMKDDSDVTFVAVQTGTILPIYIKKVYATSTTATNLVGLL